MSENCSLETTERSRIKVHIRRVSQVVLSNSVFRAESEHSSYPLPITFLNSHLTSISFHESLDTWWVSLLVLLLSEKHTSKPILVQLMQVSLICEAHACWSAGIRALSTSAPLFLITYCGVCKQDTLSHHFIRRSCKYFGGSHQLRLDSKHLARVTTATLQLFRPLKPE